MDTCHIYISTFNSLQLLCYIQLFVFSLQVNSNSPAEKAGLQPGDALIKINNTELFNLTHKDAQNAIVRAGNNFELTVQRWEFFYLIDLLVQSY